MLLVKDSVLSLKKKKQHTSVFLPSNCPKVLKIVYGSPVKY